MGVGIEEGGERPPHPLLLLALHEMSDLPSLEVKVPEPGLVAHVHTAPATSALLWARRVCLHKDPTVQP